MAYTILAATALLYLSLGFSWVRKSILPRWKAGIVLDVLYLLYVLCAFVGGVTQSPWWDSLRVFVYLLLPVLLQAARHDLPFFQKKPLLQNLLDLATVLVLWFPIEFEVLPNWRAGGVPIMLVLALLHMLLVFQIFYPITGMGFNFRLKLKDIPLALGVLVLIAALAIPPGILMNFLKFGWKDPSFQKMAIALVTGYFFVALPEEILFRGVIQNKLEQAFPSYKNAMLIVTALIFGLAHVNNKSVFYQPPNWPYVLLATIAGLGYGYVYRRSGSVVVSAITHASLNFIWQFTLRG